MTPPHVFFYVQHLLGIGHLARASRIARALIAEGMQVTLVTGGLPVPGFPGADIPHLALPPVAVADGAFRGLVDATGTPVDAAFLDRRRDALLAAFHQTRPDVVMIEAFPFGRKQVRFELLPLIEAVEAARPRPILVTSLRDILQRRGKIERDEETADLVNRHFDRVLVHGDPRFAALGDSFPLAQRIAEKVVYTGLVCPPPPAPPVERFDVVVSAGGGAVGAAVVHAAAAAARILPEVPSWCIITGPNLRQRDYDALAAAVPPSVTLTRFRSDLTSLMSGSRLSVSQAGYNTVGDILLAGCRAILIPYTAQGETEQADRAERLARLGRATVLEDTGLTAEGLAEAVKGTLAQTLSPSVPHLDTNGASRTARILQQLVTGAEIVGL